IVEPPRDGQGRAARAGPPDRARSARPPGARARLRLSLSSKKNPSGRQNAGHPGAHAYSFTLLGERGAREREGQGRRLLLLRPGLDRLRGRLDGGVGRLLEGAGESLLDRGRPLVLIHIHFNLLLLYRILIGAGTVLSRQNPRPPAFLQVARRDDSSV